MEEAQSKIDSVGSQPSIALASRTINLYVVEREMLELFDGPRRKHNPR